MRPVNWQSPINWNHSLNRGLVAWWLNAPHWQGGTIWRDLTGQHPGTLTAMDPANDWLTASGRPGGFGALDFDQSADRIAVTSTPKLVMGDGSSDVAFSVSAWVFMRDATEFSVVSKATDSTSAEWVFVISNGDQFRMTSFDQNTGNRIGRNETATSTIHENKWIHLAGCYDGSGAASGFRMYRNGLRVDDADNTGGAYTATKDLGESVEIGVAYRVNLARFANGLIDDVRIWQERVLQPAEVMSYYVESKTGYPNILRRLVSRARQAPAAVGGGRIMSSLAASGGLAGSGGISGVGGGLAG